MNKKMTQQLLLLFIIALFFCGFLNWPVEKVLLTATFGESRKDHFHNGIDLGGGDQKVYPIKKGALLYYYDAALHPLYKNFGNGNIYIMQHKNNSRSFYYHLKKGSINHQQKVLKKGDTIAVTANSGRSLGAHLHLTYKKRDTFINPLTLFPKIKDKKKPKIASIYFMVDGRLITIRKKHKLTGVSEFSFLAKVYDTYKKIERIAVLGIYKIEFYIDRTKVAAYSFDKFLSDKGRMIMPKKMQFAAVYHKASIYKGGSYKNIVGMHQFTVKAWDYSGNMAKKSVTVTFK